MKEIWRDISGYEGDYQVSNLGRVKSVERTRIRRDSRGLYTPRYIPERILTPIPNGNGYEYVSLRDGVGRKNFYVHRLVAYAFCQNPHRKPCVNHKDHNRSNNVADNLEWATAKENVNYSLHLMRHARIGARLPTTGERYIQKAKSHGKDCYRFVFKPAGIDKKSKNIEELIAYREEVLKEWRNYSAIYAADMGK